MLNKNLDVNDYLGKMGQNQPIRLSEDDIKGLSVNLLREWWFTTVQALTEIAGLDTAIERLTPYQTNAAIAFGRNMPAILNIHERSLQTTNYLMSLVYSVLFATTDEGYSVSIGKNEIETATNDCVTKGNVPAVCKTFCDAGGRATAESFCPEIDYRLETSLGSGDRSCTFIWRDKRAIDDGDRTARPRNDLIFDENIKKELAPHFFGELWTFSTRAFLDFSNEQSVFDKLASYMHHSGQSTGMRIIEKYGVFADADTLIPFFESLWLMHHPRSGFTRSPSALECTIEDCPFSSSPPEICLQFEAFFNGICKAIDPSYEFSYDRMMTKGDKTCHWTIRKKGELAKEPQKTSDQDEMLKKLKWRLTNGEITPEEYRELRGLLLEK